MVTDGHTHSLAATPVNSHPTPRIEALDLTKGVLVIVMVVYHSLNYTSEYYLAFRYLSFLPPSFIFITGYLISTVYFARYDGHNLQIQKRLFARGGKLLVLFTLLNVLAHLMIRHRHSGERVDVFTFFEHWKEVYITGAGRFAVFEVLLPISYLLILAPLFILAAYRQRFLLLAVTVVVLALCTFLENQGYLFANLNLLSAGTVGMLVGQLPTARLGVLGRYVIVTALAYAAYAYLGAMIGQWYLGQLLGATVALALIFGVCSRFELWVWPRRQLVRLGQYSLLAYIIQIGFLQVLSRIVHRPAPISFGSAFLFIATLVLTVASVGLAEWARGRSTGMDKLYKAIFA